MRAERRDVPTLDASRAASVVVFGLKDTFDFFHLGGMDSFYRRVARSLLRENVSVAFVQYGFPEYRELWPRNGPRIIQCVTFNDALQVLREVSPRTVLVNAIHRRDRLQFIRFRKHEKRMRFGIVYSVFAEERLRRELYFAESFLSPYDFALAVSPRLRDLSQARRANGHLFLPPVSSEYFAATRPSSDDGRLRVTFLGRIDPGKGVGRVLDLFRSLPASEFDCSISGYVWPHSAACRSLHQELLGMSNLNYEPVEYAEWSDEIERALVEKLRKTDVLVLPYERLSSTVDMPLLLLEGMAAGCAVVAPELGDIREVYGESEFLMSGTSDFGPQAALVLRRNRESIQLESARVRKVAGGYGLDEGGTVERLRAVRAI